MHISYYPETDCPPFLGFISLKYLPGVGNGTVILTKLS